MKNCGYCGRENVDQATQCHECGTEFEPAQSVTRQPDITSTSPKADRTAAEKNMLHGAMWCGGGILVTVVSFSTASSGGTYFLAWGAILFGAIQFFSGLVNLNKAPSDVIRDEVAYEVLAEAARLEAQGRIQEATEAYQKIVDTFPGKPVARDAQIGLDELRRRVV